MSKHTFLNSSQQKSRLARLTIAIMISLLASLSLLGGVWAKRSVSRSSDMRNEPNWNAGQSQTQSQSQPSGLSQSPAPGNGSQITTIPQGQTYIGFDDLPTGTIITNQYPPAVFSTVSPWYLVAHNQFYDGTFSNYGSSPPNILDHAPIVYPHAYAPLYVDFTQPVNNLRFYVLAVDDFRPSIAQINIYQNHSPSPSATRDIAGFGTFYIPVLVDIGAWGYNNVTRIEVFNITDVNGIGYDDFSFTVAPAPTPTPTPLPSPTPFPPTNLIAEGDRDKVSMIWDAASGATSYSLRRQTSTTPWQIIATGIVPTSIAGTLVNRYEDSDVIPDTTYSYEVTAISATGESGPSNVASATLLPSCGEYIEPRPPLESTSNLAGTGWALTANVSDRDGLVLTDVSLNGRYMAAMMSVPYYFLKTNKMTVPSRGELTPQGDAPTMRAHLYRYYAPSNRPGTIHITAKYAVDHLTPTSKSCLMITQDYEFDPRYPGDKCEPSGQLPCARFYPRTSYQFIGRDGETLESINIPERLHYRVGGSNANTIGLMRDWDAPPVMPAQSMFQSERNPLATETLTRVVQNGRDLAIWDNIHQTNKDHVSHPMESSLLFFAGCPECVHTHWRWPAYLQLPPISFGDATGSPTVGNFASLLFQTNQNVDLGIVRYRPGEEHPNFDFTPLVNKESLRNPIVKYALPTPRIPSLRYTVMGPSDVLYWYSGTSFEPEADLFFKHGSFFNPDPHAGMMVSKQSGSAGSSPQAVQDGVRSITYGHVYVDGNTSFTSVNASTLALLPAGYVPLDNRAYQISTDAIVSGPDVVAFDVPLVTDQATFNNLAIFHLEQDPFDPDNMVWVDDTILSPNTPGPDFNNRIISARVNDIGYFAIGQLVQAQPDLGSSDLSVTISHSPEPVVVENNLTYSLHVTNQGPQAATGVGVIDALPQEATFSSVSSTQGTCKYSNGSVYCKLGTMTNGGTADVTITARTFEDKAGITSPGRSIVDTAVVAADNDDANLDNNSATDTALLLPNPNARPTVSITSPTNGATFVGLTNVTLTATASDSDGSISRVDFYDASTLVASATPTAAANQYQLSVNATIGTHTFVAVATDNGGRTNSSDPVNILVNGTASINITSPSAGSVFDPSSNLTVTAEATNSSGPISKVEFFANAISLGAGSVNGNQFSVGWNNVPAGNYILRAVLTDNSGVVTNSAPIGVTVTTRPSVAIVTPINGTTYPLLSKVSVMATAQATEGFINKVDFYANGTLIGTGSVIGQDRFNVDWMQAPNGIYSLTAVATDNFGVTTTSAPITIGVNTPSPQAGEFIWFDDDLPAGASKHADGDVDWYWTSANPAPFSGTKAHQSRNFAATDSSTGFHQHYFDGATATLPVNAGDTMFTYVFLDINNMPRELMLQWKDANGWEHRAYWGQNTINSGTDGTNSRRYMGLLPKAGTWIRLEVPANAVGLEGSTLNGMAFSLDGGRATWDVTGKTTANAAQPPTTPPGDFVWIDDALPAGAIPAGVNDIWNWVVGPVYSGQKAHQSSGGEKYQSHSFTGAQTPMTVNPGDVLFTYVYLGDPDTTRDPRMPNQIMLQWYDGTSWEHRAYWGENYIGQQFRSLGVQGTEGQRFMGGLPTARGWYRLEVPASYVGLEGKSVSGMAFSVYRDKNKPFVTWDRSGKSPQLSTVPLPLSATSGVWRLFSNSDGYAYDTNDQGPPAHFPQKKDVFFVHPNQAAGTVPFYRFHRPNSAAGEYFYSQSKSYDGQGWVLDGIAFYVYADASTPGTVPLYLYHDNHSHYFLTTDQNEVTGMTLDGVWAYVTTTNPLVPAAPTYLSWNGYYLSWTDNSATETGFKIERVEWSGSEYVGTQVATVPANTTFFKPGSLNTWFSHFRVRATNSFGDSAYSNIKCGCWEVYETTPNTPPDVSITSPGAGDIVGIDFTIAANAFDIDGNGTIAKVEFFANGTKLGEVTTAPYVFRWNNVASGTYSLTTIATDAAGATTTSSPVSVTVDLPPVLSITSPTSGTVFNAPATVSINASASDSDGTIGKVEFFNGSTKLGEVTTAPYALSWTNVPAGNYVLTAIATDNLGRPTTSNSVGVVVDSPPSVSIASPPTGTVITAPANITINANASDSDGTISKVEFYQGATLLGTNTTNPYSFVWNNVPAGSYAITAKATDNLGAVTTSSPVSVIVNAPPTVTITSPAGATSFTAPASINISAVASDSDGTISEVEFFQGATLIGTATASPYTFNWSNLPVGNYSFSAKATDNLGAVTTSNSVSINVVQASNSNKVAFASNRDGSAQIYAMNSDGSGTVRLTNDFANDESPKWSPNNLRIVFQSDRDNLFSGLADIYVMNWDGSGQTRLTNDPADDSAPVWSPDGTKIAFQSARNGVNYQVYVMNGDGSGQVNISNSTANDTQPSWSPDGTKIAFGSDRDQPGFSSIYVMNANGTNQTRLTTSGVGVLDQQPVWSPDGMKLAFTTTRDSTVVTWDEWDGVGNMIVKTNLFINKEVYVMNADGSGQVRLTSVMGNDDSPVWSPDGTKIAFRSDRDRNCCDPIAQIWTMNADGSNQIDLSNNAFGDYCPSWSR